MKLKQEYLEFAAKSGWTATYTASVYTVTPEAVRAACKRHGITLMKGKPGREHGTQQSKDPVREAVIMQSVTEAWTQQELGYKLSVSRERARQLLKARGLDKIRVHFAGRNAHQEPKEKPIRSCRECGQIITAPGRWRLCSEGCNEAWSRRHHREKNGARYHADPAFREYQAKWQRDNPNKVAAAGRRYRNTVGGQFQLEKHKRAYAAEPKKEMQCLACGTLVERKATVIKIARQKGNRSPLCANCRTDAALARRGLSRAN